MIGTAPTEADERPWLRLAAIVALYAALGAVLGFIQGGIGPILRVRGATLPSMGWVFALYIPFGVTFVWAPLVDRWSPPWFGRRTGWILSAQGLAIMLIICIALGERLAMPILFALGLGTSVAMATMDLALDAWTVERIASPHRPMAAGAKVGGLSLGAILGGGVLVALFPHLGWRTTFTIMAALIACASAPVLLLADHDPAAPRRSAPGNILEALKRPIMLRRLFRLSLVTCSLMGLFNFNRLMLVDAGLSLQRIGWILGIAAPLANLIASVMAPVLLHRLASRTVLAILTGAAILSAAFIIVALSVSYPPLAIAGSILAGVAVSGIYVVMASLILGWAVGEQAATDYALLYGVGRLLGTLVLLGLPGLITVIGWRSFYMGCATAIVCSVCYFMAGLRLLSPKPDNISTENL